MKKVIPNSIENKIPNNRFVYYFAWLLVGFNFFRSLEHIYVKISKKPLWALQDLNL